MIETTNLPQNLRELLKSRAQYIYDLSNLRKMAVEQGDEIEAERLLIEIGANVDLYKGLLNDYSNRFIKNTSHLYIEE